MSLRERLADSDDDSMKLGLATRREVLGDAYVDAALERADGWGDLVQDVVTRRVWGDAWNREELTRPQRSLVTLAVLSAGGHGAELEAHVVGALRNGLTPEQIVEVVVHVGHYCGAPCALTAMRHVKAALDRELGPPGPADRSPAPS